ncbi:hypothetical protein HYT18_02015 [Candidatus Microgenomates bacterium]|nr:hypothetical protein [Candidatus Microgenomates bacterium]
MDEKTLGAIMIAVVYPLMILSVAWGFILLLQWSEKSRRSSKRVEHRIRK